MDHPKELAAKKRDHLPLQHVVKEPGGPLRISRLAAGTEEHVVAHGIRLHASLDG